MLFVPGIINYNFGLSAYTFPKSGVKMKILNTRRHFPMIIYSLPSDFFYVSQRSKYRGKTVWLSSLSLALVLISCLALLLLYGVALVVVDRLALLLLHRVVLCLALLLVLCLTLRGVTTLFIYNRVKLYRGNRWSKLATPQDFTPHKFLDDFWRLFQTQS
jgi:hypothetical protein